MELEYSEKEILLATYKVALENNALLRLMINNQLTLMKAINVPPNLDKTIYNSLLPVPDETLLLSPLQTILHSAESIALLLEDRVWQWAQINHSKIKTS